MATVQLFAAPAPAPWDADSLKFMTFDLNRSALSPEDLGAYPISKSKYDAPAYCIPYPSNEQGLWRVRIDREKDKYLSTPGCPPDIWLPPGQELADLYDGDLYVVEGEKKAAAVRKFWKLPNVVGIGGCWNAMVKSKTTETYKLVEHLQLLITPGRKIHLILDGDVIENKNVGRAAITLNSCIEALNGTMTLYRPPLPEYKGVDDWIYFDAKNAKPENLEVIDISKLSINRALLYKQLECSLNQDGGLILNELNAFKLLAYHFQSQGIARDKRLGFISSESRSVTPAALDQEALEYLQGTIAPRYPAGAINGALQTYIASESLAVDLVQDMVSNRLVWDGTPRLESWGSEYFETDIPKLANEWGRLLLTSLGMRILEPGCKVDTVFILNGKQGIGKTTFFEDLAIIDGHSFYKSVMDLPGSTGDDRTFKMSLAASLVVDLGEGVVFESRKTSSDRLNQFITERVDEYRIVHAKQNTIAPRGYIIVGTTNRNDQLSDLTGSRRFLYLNPVKIKRLEYATKLQLLAEVAATRAQIKATDWFNLRLTMDDLPQRLKADKEHITGVQDMLNTEYYRADALADAIEGMIQNGDFSTLKGGQEQVLTAMFIASRLNYSNLIQGANQIGRKISELNGAPTFPYKFEKVRKRAPQIDFKQGHKELYTGHITNDQVMFTCFIVTRK